MARSTAYYLKARDAVPSEQRSAPKKRGPVGAATDEDLVGHIRTLPAESPSHGEGYRDVWARLRHRGVRTASGRVRRLMREYHLLAPRRGGNPHGPKAHDGTITAEEPGRMWGTDMTTITTGEGLVHVFVAVDHCTCGCVGLHAAKGGSRFEAPEPLRQGVREHFGRFEARAAEWLTIHHDHGSNYLSDGSRRESAFLGRRASFGSPRGAGVSSGSSAPWRRTCPGSGRPPRWPSWSGRCGSSSGRTTSDD